MANSRSGKALAIIFAMMILWGCHPRTEQAVVDIGGDIFVDAVQDGRSFSEQEFSEKVAAIQASVSAEDAVPLELTILHPYDDALLPADMASPMFAWKPPDNHTRTWLLQVSLKDRPASIFVLSNVEAWTPEKGVWEFIRSAAGNEAVSVAILGQNDKSGVVDASGSVRLRISRDPVGSPIVYQQMMIPITVGQFFPERTRWLMADLSAYEAPKVLLENQKVCGMCHHFSNDGKVFGVDLDIDGDKGAYGLSPVKKHIRLKKENFISWTDYQQDGNVTLGLFSKISPDGRNVVATIREKRMFFQINDLDFSELFFPFEGTLACYSLAEKRFFDLPGADNPAYVHVGADWSPDGRYLVFSRARARTEYRQVMKGETAISAHRLERIDELNRRYPMRYDLYRIPFNDGRGGEALPLDGAAGNGKSYYWPRHSPDGRWIVFTRSDNAIMNQPGSELFIIPAEGGRARRMNCSREWHNSWHSWSPNSRWIVFSSKVNTPYTELFIAHVDENGNDSPPVLLSRLAARNLASVMPEFANIDPDDLQKITVD